MSGINGIASLIGLNNIEQRIQKMNGAIAHRGYCSSGRCMNSKLAFGHLSLSIVARNHKPQPVISVSKRWIVLLDGELYNTDVLKNILSNDSSCLSDAEIILAYIEKYSVQKLVEKAKGMFALCIYDSFEKKLYLVKDKMGIKPLYYALSNGHLVFSSEVKGILNSGLVEAKFKEEAIDEYLGNRFIRAPYTFFEGIYQVEAGTYIVVDSKMKLTKIKYWDLPSEFNFDINYNETLILHEFKDLLIDSIKKRLASDVRLGTYLSGGIDSSLVTAITTKLLTKRIDTFTIGFNNLNEFTYANLVANKYCTNHHTIEMSLEDYFTLLESCIMIRDAPLSVPNEIPLAFMSKVLRQKVGVILSGEGADELLGGYGRIFRAPFDFANQQDQGKELEFYDYFIGKYEYVA